MRSYAIWSREGSTMAVRVLLVEACAMRSREGAVIRQGENYLLAWTLVHGANYSCVR
jgi:hypothetical protein